MARKPGSDSSEVKRSRADSAARRPRLAAVLARSGDALARSSEPRQQLSILFNAATARRLREHCAATNQEISGWVDRAVSAALDAAGIGTADGKPKRRARPR